MRTLALLAFLTSAAYAQEDDELISSLERQYQTVLKSAEKVTVTIFVDRIDEEKPPARRPGIPMMTGGVFAKRPPKELPVSGTILDTEGHILTTSFNINNGKAVSIKAVLPDGREYEAEVVGYHELYDVALLKVDAKNLEALKGADLKQLKPGTRVAACGRAPNGRGLTINPGIFSAPGRDGGRTCQIDCRMNYGNVGGPLLDMNGDLIGVTVKVRKQEAASFGQNSGVSFALPYDQIKDILPALKRGIKVEERRGAFLGISGRDWADGDGVEVLTVMGGTAAESAGLEVGDIIVKLGGKKVAGMAGLRDVILRHKVGDKVKVLLSRNGEERELEVKLGERGGR